MYESVRPLVRRARPLLRRAKPMLEWSPPLAARARAAAERTGLLEAMQDEAPQVIPADEEFVRVAYRRLLGRDPDPSGLAHHGRALAGGLDRGEFVMSLAESDEYIRRVLVRNSPIQNLFELRPDRYRTEPDVSDSGSVNVFVADGPEDFDWLEKGILAYGYYEKPGVWSFEIDLDKRVMAEFVALLGPSSALEIGCANGATMACLQELGVHAEGVDISAMALRLAPASVRDRIILADLLEVDTGRTYDVVYGLDVFEHFNPNRLSAYVERACSLVRPGGYLFANIPAFGDDPVYGTVFPFSVRGWEEEAAAGRIFSRLEVDEHGYPLNGHLVWADWVWWVSRFEATGLVREPEIERALHARYDQYFEATSVARKTFFVFSKPPCTSGVETLERITSSRSKALAEAGFPA